MFRKYRYRCQIFKTSITDRLCAGLRSLSSLDLSHNQIVALGPGSLAGMPRLQHLALAHNYLQAVSGAWLRPLPSLETLLVMDNDISLVEEGSLDTLTNLTEINLAGELSAAPRLLVLAGRRLRNYACVQFFCRQSSTRPSLSASLLSATSQLINIHEPE